MHRPVLPRPVLHHPRHPEGHARGGLMNDEQLHELVLVFPSSAPPPGAALHAELDSLHRRGVLRRPLSARHVAAWRTPNEAHVAAAHTFAARHGFEILEQSSVRGDFVVRGPVGAVNEAFQVQLRRYAHDGVGYHGHDETARIPQELVSGVSSVLGLNGVPHRRRRVSHPADSLVDADDIASRYRFPAMGEVLPGGIAVLEFGGGFHPSDLEAFQPGLAERVRVHRVPGAVGVKSNRPMPYDELAAFATAWKEGRRPSGASASDFTNFVNTVEVTMDIELLGGLAPTVPIDVFFAPPGADGWWRGLWAVLGHPLGGEGGREPPSVLSISWSEAEREFGSEGLGVLDHAIHALSVCGVTVCCSSGDDGSSGGEKAPEAATHFPASSPHAMAVGGSMLTDLTDPQRSSEVAWKDEALKMATSGGMSGFFVRPHFQAGVTARPLPGTWRAPGGASGTGRWVPDVAALAGFQLKTVVGGVELPGGGTSAATPIWAALIARVSGIVGRRLGPIHRLLYSDPAPGVSDVTSGSNDVTGIGGYEASEGWDPCTGLGVPDGSAFLGMVRRRLKLVEGSLDARIRVDRSLGVWRYPGEGVVLLSERENRVLYGALYPELFPLLDGRGSAAEVAQYLDARWDAAAVLYAIDELAADGIVETAGASTDATAVAQPETTNRAPLAIDPSTAWSNLNASGVSPHVVRVGGREVQVVLVDDYLRPVLASMNAQAIRGRMNPWLLAKPVGRVVWIGPLFQPGEAGCWACMAARLRCNREIEAWVGRQEGMQELPRPPQPTDEVGFRDALAAIEATAEGLVVESAWSAARGSLTTLDGGVRTEHDFAPRPQCPDCGDPTLVSRMGSRRPNLREGRKVSMDDGGHRTRDAASVALDLHRWVDPILGVVRELEKVEVQETPDFHVYLAGGNPGQPAYSLADLGAGLRSRSCGKGKSDAQARASALAEAIERRSAVFQGDEARMPGSLATLGTRAVNPRTLVHFSERQIESRDEINAQVGRRGDAMLEWIPPSFDPHAQIDWSPAWPIDGDEPLLVPTMFLYRAMPVPPAGAFCMGDSNGTSAGSTVEEAVLQGAMELVERDAVAIWWYNRLERPAVDLSHIADPYLERLHFEYERIGREFWVLDITTDLGIPVYAAISRRFNKPAEEILFGFGAHLDSQVAVGRALTELNQMVAQDLQRPLGSRSAGPLGHWMATATLEECRYLAPRGTPLPLSTRRTPAHDLLIEDVRWVARRLRSVGSDLLVTDQTRPDIGLPVVKVVAPGLRHFRPRFAPGRLYDVPVAMDWRSSPTEESELNPVPFML